MLWLLACVHHPKPPPISAAQIGAIQEELAVRAAKDQEVRRGPPPWRPVDEDNTAWLRTVVDAWGWPTISVFGARAARDAWLILQHSPDPGFQERGLALLEPLVETGEASRKDLALLLDRVRTHQGRPQVYGSQFLITPPAMRPCPLEGTLADVDERRAAIGLTPMADYAASMATRHPALSWSLEPWPDCAPLVTVP